MVAPLFSITQSKQFTTPSLEAEDWDSLDGELRAVLADFHHELSSLSTGEEVASAGDRLIHVVRDFFAQRELFNGVSSSHSDSYIRHDSKSLQAARKEKMHRKKVAEVSGDQEDKKRMFQAIKAVSCLRKEISRRWQHTDASHQEMLYRKQFFHFAKLATNGLLGKGQVEPSFTKREADLHYLGTYESAKTSEETDWSWFPAIKSPSVPFDLSPITPSLVKATLRKANIHSAAGFDGVTYSLLAKLPSMHHILATLFSKVLAFGRPPATWSQAKIKLIHKGGVSVSSASDFRMISLLPCMGKLFSLIIAERLNRFISANDSINPIVQKGFRQKCNGVVEHNMVLEEVMCAARSKKRTAHFSFLDIKDAFGSVDHQLVKYALERNGIPDIVVSCIMSFLLNARGQVVSEKWTSEVFTFKSGLMQGHPLSPALFIMAFNPILDWILSLEVRGFHLSDSCSVNCLAFCDDVTIISSDKRFHQKLINELNVKLRSMGLHLKPSKSRSLSICAGRPMVVRFYLNGEEVPSVQESDHKFLGAHISFSNNQKALAIKLQRTLIEKLSNLDRSLVRGEYKLKIYQAYVLPSIRFVLTVHTIGKTLLDRLDGEAMVFLKRWSGVPKCGTRLIFHSERFLNIPTINQLYEETHCLALYSSVARRDSRVKEALESKWVRESNGSKLSQTQGFSNTIKEALGQAGSPMDLYEAVAEPTGMADLKSGKLKIKAQIKTKNQGLIHERAKELPLQGQLLSLAAEEECDVSWKAFAFSLPKSLLKFGLNSAINVLPSLSNLRRWGKSRTEKCPRCGWTETPKHLLSCCKVFLEQGRYTARHNAVLGEIVRHIDTDRFTVYADLEGKKFNGGTIPPSILVTAEIPDLVILDNESGEMAVWELSVCYEDRFEASHDYKTNKYASLINDLSEKRSVGFETIEIGARGYVNERNRRVLKDLHSFTTGITTKEYIASIGRTALTVSYYIFSSRHNTSWLDPQFDLAE